MTDATYHVVCHDCTHENIWTGESAAERDVYLHGGEHDHNVEYAAVDDDV